MGQLQTDTPELDRQMNIPGIATALQPRGNSSHGVHSLMDLLMKLPEPISHDCETTTSSLPENIGPISVSLHFIHWLTV